MSKAYADGYAAGLTAGFEYWSESSIKLELLQITSGQLTSAKVLYEWITEAKNDS